LALSNLVRRVWPWNASRLFYTFYWIHFEKKLHLETEAANRRHPVAVSPPCHRLAFFVILSYRDAAVPFLFYVCSAKGMVCETKRQSRSRSFTVPSRLELAARA
jgi:hypothetical protein